MTQTAAVAALLAGLAACGNAGTHSRVPAQEGGGGAPGRSFNGQPLAISVADDGTIRVAGITQLPGGETAFLDRIDTAGTVNARATDTSFPNDVWLGGTFDATGQAYVLSCPYVFRPTFPLAPGSACSTVKLTDAGVQWRIALALQSVAPADDGGIYGIASEVVELDGTVSGLGNSLSLVDAQGHLLWNKPVVFPTSEQAFLKQLTRSDDGGLLVLAQISDTPWIARFGPDGELRTTIRLDLAGSLPTMISPAHRSGAYVIVSDPRDPSQPKTDLVRIDDDGALLWTSALGESAAALAVAPDDAAVVAAGTFGNAPGRILQFDATGALVATTNVPESVDVAVLSFDGAEHVYAAGNVSSKTLGSAHGFVKQLGTGPLTP